MKKFLLALSICSFINHVSFSQEKRALIIAINQYLPPADAKIDGFARSAFLNLDGCLNDGRAMQTIIQTKFHFPSKNIDTLFNEAATRQAMEEQMLALLEKSKTGDIAFIFYAGHGSQVINSLASEADKKDESMVPADTWKPGVKDFRDKELAIIYNKFLDKGVKLTVILDCCHSGSLSRGPIMPGKFRFMENPKYDVKDPSQPIAPETRKDGDFLIISAAQDNEFAQEQTDENNMHYGAFTLALIKAINQQSVNASVQNLFTSLRAIIKSNGKKQEPVLGGSLQRQQQTLFGIEKGTIPEKSLIAINGISEGKVKLQAGFALGLQEENELVKFAGKDTLVKLKVISIDGVNQATAIIIKGTINQLSAGELLEVTNWVSSTAPLLKLYIVPGKVDYEAMLKLATVNNELRKSGKIRWINNLEKTDPYTSLFYDGEKFIINTDGNIQSATVALTSNSILSLIKKDSTFYFEMPVYKELADAILNKLKTNKSIVVVNNLVDAHYIVYGTLDDDGNPAYGLRRTQTAARDSLEAMPVSTKAFSIDNKTLAKREQVANQLYEYAMRLSKIRGWLQLSPPEEAGDSFPFHLELRDKNTNSAITNNEYKLGQKVTFHLIANDDYLYANKHTRYVYVFMIDKEGNMQLGFPEKEDGNVLNQFPKIDNRRELVRDVMLFEGEAFEPVGIDHFFLLASDEPIPNYNLVFNQEGVRGNTNTNNLLGNLLNMGNEGGTRSVTKSVSNWTLIKLAVHSVR